MPNEENASVAGKSDEELLAEEQKSAENDQQATATESGIEGDVVDAESSQEQPADQESLMRTLEETRSALEETKQQSQDYWEQLLRAKAELDNAQKRGERDLENLRKYGLEKFASELLPVKDSLEMGLEAATQENQDVDKIREGLALTLKMFDGVLEKFNVKEINPLGDTFDPEYHEAMSVADSTEHEPNKVMLVYQKGYSLNDRLIRSAKVVVSKSPENSEGS